MSKAISVEQIDAIQAALAAAMARTRVGDCQTDLEPISAVMEAILGSDDVIPGPEEKEIDQDSGIPAHLVENRDFCEREWADNFGETFSRVWRINAVGKLQGSVNFKAWWGKLSPCLKMFRRYFMYECQIGENKSGWLSALEHRNAGTIVENATRFRFEAALRFHTNEQKVISQRMYASLRLQVSDDVLTRVEPTNRAIQHPAVFIACVCECHTVQGPQKHINLLKEEMQLSYVKFSGRKGGGSVSQFCAHVKSLFAEIEDPRGKEGDLDVRSDRSDANFIEKGLPNAKLNSRGGLVVKVCGGPIHCRSKVQKIQAFSTQESEYMELAEACKRGKIYLNLFEEIGMYNPEVDRPIIFEDNAAAGILATSDVLNSKSRHMNLRFSICKEMIMENKTFQLWHLPTKFQLADINTKAVGAKTFRSIDPVLRGLVLLDHKSRAIPFAEYLRRIKRAKK